MGPIIRCMLLAALPCLPLPATAGAILDREPEPIELRTDAAHRAAWHRLLRKELGWFAWRRGACRTGSPGCERQADDNEADGQDEGQSSSGNGGGNR